MKTYMELAIPAVVDETWRDMSVASHAIDLLLRL